MALIILLFMGQFGLSAGHFVQTLGASMFKDTEER